MTKEQERRVIEAIADCDKYIAKEGARNPSLQPADTEKLLQWYIGHRTKLTEMLASGEWQ